MAEDGGETPSDQVKKPMAGRRVVTEDTIVDLAAERKARAVKTPKKRRAPSRRGARGGTGTAGGSAGPFDPKELNMRFAVVRIGAGAMIVEERLDGPVEDRIRLLSREGFKLVFANQFTTVAGRAVKAPPRCSSRRCDRSTASRAGGSAASPPA